MIDEKAKEKNKWEKDAFGDISNSSVLRANKRKERVLGNERKEQKNSE